jgi:hypothetical protein
LVSGHCARLFGMRMSLSFGNLDRMRAAAALSRGVGVPSASVSTVWTRTTAPVLSFTAVIST